MDAEVRILQPSSIAKLLEQGHVALVIRLAKKEFKVAWKLRKHRKLRKHWRLRKHRKLRKHWKLRNQKRS